MCVGKLPACSLSHSSVRPGRAVQGMKMGMKVLGYSNDIDLTVVVRGGKIADIWVRHQEKIDQNACVVIPRRIIDGQTLQVDGISGATITKDAIVFGTYRALKKAGLE